jgi:hypothetical protein
MTPAKRRWPRFSLRTLFVAVTVLCLWLGYELNWIHLRNEFLAQAPQAKGLPFCTMAPVSDSVPFGLRIFGEKRVSGVHLVYQTGERPNGDQVERIVGLFPEAEISVYCGYNPGRSCAPRPLTPALGKLTGYAPLAPNPGKPISE